ncbi:hypothetical protein [Luteibacter sp.]|jgi:hypothetical protein|uniref:hypothetical protein n=1 Tax=Luteibacter sp. TaxID=1886636 RepID=UPI002F3F55D5
MKPKKGPLCVITIGFQTFLMPVTAGMKLVQLLGQAIECEEFYAGTYERRYTAGKQVDVHLATVRDDQVRLPDPEPKQRKVLRLEGPQ